MTDRQKSSTQSDKQTHRKKVKGLTDASFPVKAKHTVNGNRVPEWLVHNKCRHVLSVTLLPLGEREEQREREGGREREEEEK